MSHERVVERLNDYVDGELPERSRQDVEAHLIACESCRARVASLRALLDEAAALPRNIEPSRDLWPEIGARLAYRAQGRGLPALSLWRRLPSRRRGARRPSRGALAAAAVLLMAVASVFVVWVAEKPVIEPAASGDRVAAGAAGAAGAGGVALVADWRMLEREYEQAAGELEEALDAAGTELSLDTRRIIERNLRVIDRAIAESRAALARDPANPALARVLSLTYERKLEMLRHVARL